MSILKDSFGFSLSISYEIYNRRMSDGDFRKKASKELLVRGQKEDISI